MYEPQLVTLEGDYSSPTRRPVRRMSSNDRQRYIQAARQRRDFWKRHGQQPETMDGLLDWGKSVVKSSLSPITSSIKGIGHTVMEAGRGISSGDIKRVLAAPVKGTGHTVLSWGRDTKEHAEWYYRPSKMRQWMKPVGGLVTAAGAIPTPASPFLLAGGAALTAGGAIGDKIYQEGKRRQAIREGQKEQENQAVAASQKNNIYIYGAIGIGALALITLTM